MRAVLPAATACTRAIQLLPIQPFSIIKPTQSHAVGLPYHNFITLSTSEVLLKMTERSPHKIALHCYQQQRELTYEELTSKAIQLANTFVKQFELKPKDRIGIYSFNKWEWYVVQLAAAFADLIVVNINPSYRPEELAFTLNMVEVKVLFLSDRYRKSDFLHILRETVPELNHPDTNPYSINSARFQNLLSIVRMNESQDSHQKGFVNFTSLFHNGSSLQRLPKAPSCHDPANIQFTSGTTGKPKAATLSHHNILNNGLIIGNRCGYTSNDNICVPVPLYHCFGMVMGNLAALTRGGSLTYVCQGFDAQKTMEAVSKYHCTSLYGVPTMFSEYLRVYEQNKEKYDISSLRTGIIAGSLAPEVLMERILHTLGITEITNCYGMTETSPVTFQTKQSDEFGNKTKTVGTILEGLEAKIVDESGKVCEIGKPGEFVVKGWAVMSGYWGNQEATREAIRDGWMHSGDIGVFDKEGYLSIVGRIKDMIIRGGENVYPKEIEEFLNKKLHGALDVQVVAVSDEKFGEQIAAVIKVENLQTNLIKKTDILDLCKDHIAHYKVPKYVKFVTEYPLTVTGKIQKFVLKEQLEDEKANKGLDQYAIR